MEFDDALEFAAQIEYVRNLRMPDPSSEVMMQRMKFARLMIKDVPSTVSEEDSADVVGDSVVSYIGGLTPQEKEDVSDSALFAQIGASEYFNPETQRREWYKKYTEVLTHLGWVTTNDAYQEYKPSGISFTMDEAALQIIAAVAGPNKLLFLRLAKAAFDALSKDEGALQLFDSKSKTNNSGNFQILPCVRSEDGDLMLLVNCMQFTSKKNVTKVLFFKFSSEEVTVYRAAAVRNLNKRAYNAVRKIVQDKVDAFRAEYIKNLL